MADIEIPITPEQVALLHETQATTDASIAKMSTMLAVIMAGKGITTGAFKVLNTGPPPVLVVTVPDEPPIGEPAA